MNTIVNAALFLNLPIISQHGRRNCHAKAFVFSIIKSPAKTEKVTKKSPAKTEKVTKTEKNTRENKPRMQIPEITHVFKYFVNLVSYPSCNRKDDLPIYKQIGCLSNGIPFGS